ncbi:MAG: glycosyltransferase family protein, partial [Porticoccaceae bacterium]
MRILYGVQGTGNGHITRARAMAKAMADQGLAVDYLFSGREADQFFDMEPFGNYQLRAGFTLAIEAGRLRSVGTLRKLNPRRFLREVRSLDLSQYDLILTDFEPVTAWAARLRHKPCVGIGHQYAFHYPVPRPGGNYHQRLLLRWMAPADTCLGLHWYHFDAPLLPPVAPVAEAGGARDPALVVVYLPFETPAAISALLTPCADFQFAVYHPDADDAAACAAHIHWQRPNRHGFHQELARSGGVICSAG